MKILFVTPRLPLPADTGAKIRTFNLLQSAARENQVSLLSFYFDDDPLAVKKLKDLDIEVHLVNKKETINPLTFFGRKPLFIEKYYSEEMENKFKALIKDEKFDLVHFDHLHMGQYVNHINGIPAVLDEHNVEFLILQRLAELEKSALKTKLFEMQAQKLRDYESELISRFSRCLVVSENDRKSLLKVSADKARVEVIPNGVDTEYFAVAPGRIGSAGIPLSAGTVPTSSLVFTGSMDWLPNTDAVIYFCREILPLIWRNNAEVKFYIVGKDPDKEVLALANKDKRIIVTGLVDDVRPYINQAKVFVVPIRIAGGTRLKILEAMAMGKPVVSTTIGAEGINYTVGKNIVLKDTPQEFACAVLGLLEDGALYQTLSSAGRELVLRQYDWNIIGKKLNSVYKEVAGV